MNVESILDTIHGYSIGQYKLRCPSIECQNRKKKNLKTLSVNITADKFVYMCHHCGTSGAKRFDNKGEVFGMELVRLNDVQPLSDKGLEWLSKSGWGFSYSWSIWFLKNYKNYDYIYLSSLWNYISLLSVLYCFHIGNFSSKLLLLRLYLLHRQ